MSLIKEIVEAIEVANKPGANDLYKSLKKILNKGQKDLSERKSQSRSHSVGGNYSAVVSGAVKTVEDFVQHGQYHSQHWDLCLQVGNNIEGGNALNAVQAIFKDMVLEAQGHTPNKFETHHDVFHSYFDDGSVSCKYEYARSFCWIAISKHDAKKK